MTMRSGKHPVKGRVGCQSASGLSPFPANNQGGCQDCECALHYPPRSIAMPTSASPMATIAKPATSRLVLA